MNRRETLLWLKKEFSALGIEEARQEARLALSHVLAVSISGLYVSGDLPVEEPVNGRLFEILQRRSTGEPLAYILGERYFMGMRMEVNASVLIPRQETELLCEKAIERIRREKFTDALDVCTGSGCIAVSLAKYTAARVTASDISAAALETAKKNAAAHQVNIWFVLSDLFQAIKGEYAIITVNPPYISEEEYKRLPTGIRAFEPGIALQGGPDGLDFYRRIAQTVPAHMRPGGTVLLEIGSDQAKAVCSLLARAGLGAIRVLQDYAGLDRIVLAEKNV